MLFFKMSDIEQYRGLSKNLDTAFTYLITHDLKELCQGRNEVDGENVYSNRFSYQTLPKEETFYEAHLQYIDIHVLLSGEEAIEGADVTDLRETDRDEANDFVGYAGEETWLFHMVPGSVLVAFPQDAHRVKIRERDVSNVEKVVIKVKM